MIQFRLFVLQKHSPQSHTYMGDVRRAVDRNSTETVESLAETIRDYLKSRSDLKSWGEDVDDVDFAVHRSPARLSPKKGRLVEMANDNQLNESDALESDAGLGTLCDSPELVFVFETLSFRFVLFETIGSSRKCFAVGRTTALPTQTTNVIKKTAQDSIKAHLGSGLEADVGVWEPKQPFELDDRPTPQSMKQLGELVSGGYMKNCSECHSDLALESIIHREHLVIVFTLRVGFVLFEKGPSTYRCIGTKQLVASSEDLTKVVQQAATQEILSMEEDPAVQTTVNYVTVYEPKSSYEAYNQTLEEMEKLELDGDKLARAKGLVTPLFDEDPLRIISSTNLIVECDITRHRKLRFKFILFERKSESYEHAGRGFVEATSGQTMRVIWEAVRDEIKSDPKQSTNTGHHIEIYEPTKAFEAIYNKPIRDLDSLELEEQHFRDSPRKFAKLRPEEILSDVDAGQTLVAVFDLPPPPVHTLSDMFLRMTIASEPPSKISEPKNYQALQKQPGQRILDDRPEADGLIPPISLLYDGFGIFEDVFHEGLPVPGESEILEAKLWDEVNDFADEMAAFYGNEAERRGVIHGCLAKIFLARRDPLATGEEIMTSKIGSRQIISDGHSKGEHGAIVFCIKCKNELSGISCEPSAELVSCVASSFKDEMLKGSHQALFNGWRTPTLGMTVIGPFVQFFGIVLLVTNMRVAPLTPMLPLATPVNDEWHRRNLFLAFKAASIVIAKIQADVRELIRNPPEQIPCNLRGLPSITSITGIDAAATPPPRINFKLVGRHDEVVKHRNLYHALCASTNEGIYVKFTRQYSRDLHVFCAGRGLAPKLLGFERLPGGWIALAMEKVDIVGLSTISSFAELDTWRDSIQGLVKGFHGAGLVHGDLRLANFIFTKSSPRKMMLVDFDWGGTAGEVYFPRGQLAEGLRAKGGQDSLDQIITKGDDDRVLASTFALLDVLARRQAVGGKT